MAIALSKDIDSVLHADDKELKDILFKLCTFLQEEVDHYDWVGFYFAQPKTKTLHLGPFAGEPTDHKVIPFGKGICGQVAESHETFIVDDVHAQDNYIACSIYVKSEIVVPLFVGGKNVGQIDIDSNTANAFTEEDNTFLKSVNKKVSKLLSDTPVALETLWI